MVYLSPPTGGKQTVESCYIYHLFLWNVASFSWGNGDFCHWLVTKYTIYYNILQPRAVNVDLETDATLQVDISDALSERDKVKFTVHTKVGEFSYLSIFIPVCPGTWQMKGQ